ncbi:MAG TPA: hypothetical protein VHQ47_03635 [Phycisphaerae bacterium]|nr:hypothetical protein [Phycisphaerae bacterium]
MSRWMVAAGIAVVCGPVLGAQGPVAFPGAVGFGAEATGGRGGEVVHVTNLAEGGPGSFREAVSKGNRVVIFDVGGVITLTSPIAFPSNLTVEGQSAPGEGITIYNNACSITGQSNIILRYLRFRAGMASSRGAKALGINYSHDIILDHLTISWGRWDDTGMTAKAAPKGGGRGAGAGGEEAGGPKALMAKPADDRSHDITMQDCLVSEGLDPQRFGALLDEAMDVTVCRTLWADNDSRNPKAKGMIQVINDVVYNWQVGGLVGGHSAAQWHQDVVNNVFIAGPSTKEHSALTLYTHTDNVFSSGNLIDLDKDGKFNPRAVTEEDFRGNKAGDAPTFVKEAYNHPKAAVDVLPAAEALEYVLEHAGASLHRDAIDARIVAQVRSMGKEGAVIKDEKDVGGIGALGAGATEMAKGPLDSDHDGMPDAWEAANGLDPHDAADAGKVTAAGYTELEAYEDSLVARR